MTRPGGRHPGDGQEPPPQLGDNAAGVSLATEILTAATAARWPMYLRNVKQILRAANGFDERRYGFGGLIELLRALQREGLVRVERDRRGGLRVFQGPVLARTAAARTGASEPPRIEEPAGVEAAPETEPEAGFTPAGETEGEDEVIELAPPSLVDTTAELLGRATGRRPARSRSASPAKENGPRATTRGTRKSGTRKSAAAPKRSGRSRKPAAAAKEPTE